MNFNQLELVNQRMKNMLSVHGDLHDFLTMTDKIMRKDRAILDKQLPLIDFNELARDMTSLRIAINRISGWSDTIDIITNPEEYEYLMRESDEQKEKEVT